MPRVFDAHPNINGCDYYSFKCPGCGTVHTFRVGERAGSKGWTIEGDELKPTVRPSLLTTWKHNHSQELEPLADQAKRICHIFITDGVVEFLNDCTHSNAGKKIPLPIYED